MEAINSVISLGRRLPLAFILALVMVLSAVIVVLALPASDFNAADGNMVVESPGDDLDWESLGIVCPDEPGFGAGCLVDEPESLPGDVSDLLRGYIWHEKTDEKDFLYLGWVRASEPTDATIIDFELNQHKCEYDELGELIEGSLCSADGVTPARTAGDLLIKFDLPQGVNVPDFGYHFWLTEEYALIDPDIPDTAVDACEEVITFA